MIDWKDISEKCPKAWAKMLEWKDYLEINIEHLSNEYSGTIGWWFDDGVHHHVKMWRVYEPRNFYDFFDENKVYIDISLEVQYTREIDEDGTNPHYVPDGFYFDIHDERQQAATGGTFKTRIEAEEVAFTDAFEVLENKL